MSKSPEFKTWRGIKARCTNPRDRNYHRYGARGITVCDRWKDSFENFYADMGPRPGPEYSIDRIDNDGPYSLENCRWATRTVQSNNRRTNHFLEFQGRRMTIRDWAFELGISEYMVRKRIQYGWSVEDALTRPSSSSNKSKNDKK